MAARKRTNERSCITALFSKKSKPSETNDPQCKEDDTVALLWPRMCLLSKRSYAHAPICRQNFRFLPPLRFNPSYAPVYTMMVALIVVWMGCSY